MCRAACSGDAGRRPARVLGARDVGRDRQDAPAVQVVGEHPHGRAVRGEEVRARLDFGQPRGLRLVHGAIDAQLIGSPFAVDGEGPRDVGAVQLVGLDAHVHEQQLACFDRAVVAPPVQHGAVAAGAHDRGVADLVAFEPGPPPEGALQPPFAANIGSADHVGQLAGHIGEAAFGGIAGKLQPGDLPGVLHQPQLVDHLAQPFAGAARQQFVDARVETGQHGDAESRGTIPDRGSGWPVAWW